MGFKVNLLHMLPYDPGSVEISPKHTYSEREKHRHTHVCTTQVKIDPVAVDVK